MNFRDYEKHLGTCCHHPRPVDVHLNATDRPLIELCGVSFTRERREILSNVNLRINKGDFVAVTGPNGGGKTSLLRIILGLLKPASGAVHFPDGRSSVGYLPQKNSIDSHFPISVRDVIASGILAHTGYDSATRNSMVEEALNDVELAQLAARPIGRLSGGQLQRALLGRAIVAKPSLLVLDEPLSYIDKHFEAHIYRLIASLAPRCTIILVSHEMSTIDAMANRHIIVDHSVTECSATRHITVTTCDAS
ncbi:MAG: ATP-binding cassette domain-containing protein [Odoribacter sp.]|nr:ATP-binding cassette domain-containing protein [Odoribacter sp.]